MCLKVKTCCCGCTLQTAAKILSVLHMIGAVISLIISALAVRKASLEHSDLQQIATFLGPDNSISNSGTAGKLGVSVAQLVYFVFLIIVLCLAITAAWKNHKPKFLIPWLVIIIISIIGSIGLFIFYNVHGLYVEGIIYIIYPVFEIYFWIVIYSFYKELIENEQIPRSSIQRNTVS